MSIQPARIRQSRAWEERLCCTCVHFMPVPFTVGKCGRKGDDCPPSIVDERAFNYRKHTCGPKARYFQAKVAA